jgi:heme-degrading monooxygenase HmoA
MLWQTSIDKEQMMFAVIFEVQPKSDRWDQYLGLAKQLRPELERIDGFIENVRYSSRRTEGRLLSLSIWADEKAVIRWRTHAMHHGVQEKGRFEVFEDYHLRVGEITADTQTPPGRTLDEQRFDTTDVGAAKVITILEGSAQALPEARQMSSRDGVHDAELYESITEPGNLLLLVSWRDGAAADRWETPASVRQRRVRVIRDYGLADRREAPQFYPDVARGGGRG